MLDGEFDVETPPNMQDGGFEVGEMSDGRGGIVSGNVPNGTGPDGQSGEQKGTAW
jgi:hypothetical protein